MILAPALPADSINDMGGLIYPDSGWTDASGVGGEITVGDLVRMFEEAEEASYEARKLAERDRDFYDNKQLSEDEIAVLRKRGQPEVVINRIKRKVDYLVGLEKQQRTMPRGLPRTPIHEQDAHAVTDALRYVADTEGYQTIRSAVWRNMLIEGAAGCTVSVEAKAPSRSMLMGSTAMTPWGVAPEEYDIKLRFVSWDRFFADPHSCRLDYSDATYLGTVLWMDRDDAVAMYGDAADIIEGTLSTATYGDTYDDTPKWRVWADRKRRRLRIVQMWLKREGEWYFAEFTRGGILKCGPSPHVDDTGKTECEIVAQSAYVDRDNNRYGVVREMISPQEEINKRRSKSLHLLNTSQVLAEEGAVQDEDKARREAVKPDGWITVNPGMIDKIKFETRSDLATGQFQLLKEAKDEIDLMGPNASMQGETGDTASGRAIMASQQGGMIQMGDLLDNLRQFDKRVFRAMWSRIRQRWTAPMWVRVTDDERNIRFVGLNGQVNPETGQPGPQVAQLDTDIVIDDAPDTIAPAIEQFNALVELKKADSEGAITMRDIIEAAPNLRNKEKILGRMEEKEAQPPPPPPEVMAMQAKLEMEAQAKQAEMQRRAQEMEFEFQLKQQMAEREAALEMWKAQQAAELKRMIALEDAETRREVARITASQRPAPGSNERTMQ